MSNSEKQNSEKISKHQSYLETLANDCIDRVRYSEMLQENHPELFQLIQGNYNEDDLEFFFEASAIINDTKIAYAKLANFIDFCKTVDLDIDVTVIQNIKGFEAFLGKHDSFNMITSKKGDVYKVDSNDRDFLFESFKNNIKGVLNVIRDQDIGR